MAAPVSGWSFTFPFFPSVLPIHTGLDGAVAKSSVSGLAGTGFTSHYRFQGPVGRCKVISNTVS